MLRLRPSLTALAGAAALLGCASPAPERPLPPAGPLVQPVQIVRHGLDADAHYRTGRYFQGQARLDLAADAYRRALVEQPLHVDALNALGVVHSLQQRPELAEQAFRLALQSAPQAAHVHNNLGYHLLRNGRHAEAIVAFERARELDPGNADTQSNLASARVQMARPGEAAPAAAPVVLAPVAPAPAARDAVAPTHEPQTAPVADLRAAPAGAVPVTLEPVADGVWLLGTAKTRPAAEPSAPLAVATAASPASSMGAAAAAMRLEVANGNGATGLARTVAGRLAMAGAQRPRLTNDKPFGARASHIQYVAGAERFAEEVNARLPAPLPLARVDALDRDVRVRVLLGKDWRTS